MRSAQQTAKSDSEFAHGSRPVYMVEGIDIDLNAAISVASGPTDETTHGVVLDFEAPGEQRSRLHFRVESKPTELIEGAKLELANLDPLGKSLPDARLRAWLVDPSGRPVPKHPIQIYYTRAADKPKAKGAPRMPPIEVETDTVGRVDFFVRARKNQIKVVGYKDPYPAFVRGGGRKVVPDEYFLWVVCRRDPKWAQVAPTPAPVPPFPIPEQKKLPDLLMSEMLRLRIE
jgi:hypothetical protein